MRAPGFWQQRGGSVIPTLLSPLAALSAAATARRVSRPGWRSPVPVICCGNVTVGGAGKTTVAIDLGRRLRARGLAPHFLLRGYGGSFRGTRRVQADDTAALVGDEALLLSEVAPTWIGGNRANSARQAIAAGADTLILDDGLQNPTLAKDVALLVVDGGVGFGNARLLPAGPLREPVAAGAARCHAAVLIGEDTAGALALLPAKLPVLRARLLPCSSAELSGRRVLAFAGIARPAKFFDTVAAAGAELVDAISFPDHHRFTPDEFRRLLDRAEHRCALPVTTAKDAARLTPAQRAAVRVLRVSLAWDEVSAIELLLDQFTALRNTSMNRSISSASL
ncbi:MAG TPA: tetraacyldisaccharide 4'-kinase [Acetobacteraceae bacterium]|nr:tetraacyldisaccharide 4'-kinase [Acetobacteraceae bacterium]